MVLKNASSVTAEITWPDETFQSIQVKANGTHLVKKNSTKKASQKVTSLDYEKLQNKLGDYTHTENEYIDFKLEPLLPKQYSKLGPAADVGDVNGDGLEDIFIGGAVNQSAKLFIQKKSGQFVLEKQTVYLQDAKYEDVSAKLFDADNDQDLDILVISGGNEFPDQEQSYPVRLYINDGKGNYIRSKKFPNIYTSGQGLAIADYDKNGYLDVFVGGRMVPGKYGLPPKSYLLYNKGGRFKIEKSWNGKKIGMCTSAIFSDYDNDGDVDLMAIGEWMPVSIFKNNSGRISATPNQVENSSGWWNCIKEIKNQKDKKYILGNLGENARYKTSLEAPLKMYVSDFDKNGSTDCVISETIKSKEYPMALRDNLLDQLPYLKKKFIRYKDYASATTQEIFGDGLQTSIMYKSDRFSNSILSFSKNIPNLSSLPVEAQLFPINDLVQDKDDLILVGNDYNTEVETGRLDAGNGLIFNLSKNSIRTAKRSGLDLSGDMRKVFYLKTGKQFLVISNGGQPTFWKVNP